MRNDADLLVSKLSMTNKCHFPAKWLELDWQFDWTYNYYVAEEDK